MRLESDEGKVTSKLTLGADVTRAVNLLANDSLSNQGIKLHGKGFIVSKKAADELEGRDDVDANRIIRPFVNGSDVVRRSRNVWAIDASGLSVDELQNGFPSIYQHLTENVKPARMANRREVRRKYWWKFGETGSTFRPALEQSGAYLATTRTAKHRTFVLLDGATIPESGIVALNLRTRTLQAILSSRTHVHFTLSTCAFLGVGNDSTYNNTICFEKYPLPTLTDTQSATLKKFGERLDTFRKERLAKHDFLTMTNMYNVLERLRELDTKADVAPLSDKEKDIHEAGLISVLKDIHDDIDREVFAAYGWSDLGERLVGKPGATTPSPHKSEDQEEAEEELLTRLVALNQERAAEEKRGLVRWLRPEYQKPRLGHKVSGESQVEADLGEAVLIEERKWPSDGLEQIRTLRDMLAEADAPLPAEALATLFKGRTTAKRKSRVTEVLETLVATGAARAGEEGYFLPR